MPDTLLHCQKCHVPIVLDESLTRLNTSQLNLLLQKNKDLTTDAPEDDFIDPSQFIPKDRLAMFNEASKSEPKPIIAKLLVEEMKTHPGSLNSNSSFVILSDTEERTPEEDVTENGETGKNESHKGVEKNTDFEDGVNTISTRIKTLNHVFQILSTNQEVDHPLCEDCSGLLLENFKLKFDQSQREKDYYLTFLKKLRDRENNLAPSVTSEDLDMKLGHSLKEFQELQKLESEKLNELKALEETKKDLDHQLYELEDRFNQLNMNELNDVVKLKNGLVLDLQQKTDILEQSKALYQLHLNHLDKLRTMNIYTKVFDISFDESNKYGTINGFRLGYKVPWSEVNSALGQVVLLLAFLTRRLSVDLVNYKLVPMGSRSHIVNTSASPEGDNNPDAEGATQGKTRAVLNLYSTNEFSLGKLFNFNKMDVAMIALLDILSHIEDKLAQLDAEILLPYVISPHRDTIGGKSIRVTSNAEWTYSCKFLLTNLNWILAYTSANTN